MFIDEARVNRERIINCSARPIGECFLSENAEGMIDTVFRKFKWSARQAAQVWPLQNLSEKCRESLNQDQDKFFDFLHCVFPRGDYNPAKKDNRNLPFASIYLEVDSRHIISESGFHEFPFAAARWTKSSGEIYGRSPTMRALADIKMLNEMSKTIIKAGQKAVDPPLMVPDDGFLLPIRTTPSGINFYRKGSQDRIERMPTSDKIPLGFEMEEQRRQSIRRSYYAHLLQLPQAPNMTATEVLQRIQDQVRVLGPMVGRMFSEFLNPIVDRVFGIMLRAGWFPPVPDELAGMKIDVEYVSPIAKAMRSTEAQAPLKTIEFMGPFIQADPTLLDNFNGDEAFLEIAEIAGVPSKWLRTPDQVAELRKARNEALTEEAEKSDAERLAAGAATLQKGGLLGNAAESV
jgi:hypothetical protein